MTLLRTLRLSAVFLSCALARPAVALPTMIRLGYTNCAACHIAPQGAGLLNAYGRGIDEAQSLRAGEYQPEGEGRLTQDVRWVTQEQISTSTGKPVLGILRSRLIYRNNLALGSGFRLSTMAAIENESAPRPALPYELAITPRAVYRAPELTARAYLVNVLLSYRPTPNVEVSVGRDQLPSGINLADLSTFMRARNRLGYYDTPLQAKLYWGGKRHQLAPYVFAPSGTEPAGAGESGAGSLAEFDVFGKGRTVVGANVLRGQSRHTRRTLFGPYARLGFGKWGILAEHDFTDRTFLAAPARRFRQSTSYGQVFWATREWLVLSLIGERVKVGYPFAEQVVAGRAELAARLSSEVTVTVGARLQRNVVTGQVAPSATVQLALKPVLKPIW